MTSITLYGPPQSSYMRTARITCFEKGIDHTVEPVKLGSEQHRALHPWAKVPVLQHGDLRLYETAAITRYLDEAFDGPSLQPSSPAGRARQDQWISAINCYIYDAAVRNYGLQYIFPRGAAGKPDRAVIDANVPKVERALRLLDEAYADSAWIAGDTLSLADLYVAPLVQTACSFPEAAAVLESCPHLSRAFGAVQGRPSYARAAPPAPGN